MNQDMNQDSEFTEILKTEFDEDFLAEFGIHKSQSLRIGFSHPNLIRAVANELTAQVAEQLTGDRKATENDRFIAADETTRILDKYGISPASDSAFVTTALISEMFSDEARLARSFFNAPGARQEIGRIANRFNGEDWRTWLQQTANETAEGINQDFAQFSLQRQYDCLVFSADELRQLLANLSGRLNDCAERQSRFDEQLESNRQQRTVQSTNHQPNAQGGNFFGRIRRGTSGLLDLNRYLPGRNNASQNQSQVSENLNSIESFLAQVEFEIAATRTESAFYNALLEFFVARIRVLEVSLTNTRKRHSELLSENAKLESKRSFCLAGGEMLLNSSELTKATIEFLAPDSLRKEVLLSELREKVDSIVQVSNGELRESDVEAIVNAVAEAIAEKLSNFYVADAMVALLRFQPTFETQIHEAINQAIRTDFFSSGWHQFLTPKLNYFAALSYLQSVYEETNKQLDAVIERIAAALNLNYEMKNETFESNREEFCFYIEYFCLPVESFEFYEQNISDFEKIKNSPIYNPRFDLYD